MWAGWWELRANHPVAFAPALVPQEALPVAEIMGLPRSRVRPGATRRPNHTEILMTDMRINSLLLGAALLAGCASQAPQTAEEFRKAAPSAFMAKTETIEVARPFRDVAATFQKRAPECLEVMVKSISQTATSYQVIDAAYKPTVVVTGERAELHVQQDYKRGVIKVYTEPAGGHYLLVADAYPLDKNRTRLQLFEPSMGYDVLIRAVKGWASGENLGCPDMTKIG